MSKKSLNLIIIVVVIYGLFTYIIDSISTSKWYNFCKEMLFELKHPTPQQKIENYNDLVNADNITKDGVKRVNLDWNLFGNIYNTLPDTPIPKGTQLIVATDSSILISPEYGSRENVPSENELLAFLLNTFLPSDYESVNYKFYFKKRHKANGSDYDVSEYLYKSNASNLYYKVTFEYQYIDKNQVLDYYSHVSLDKQSNYQ